MSGVFSSGISSWAQYDFSNMLPLYLDFLSSPFRPSACLVQLVLLLAFRSACAMFVSCRVCLPAGHPFSVIVASVSCACTLRSCGASRRCSPVVRDRIFPYAAHAGGIPLPGFAFAVRLSPLSAPALGTCFLDSWHAKVKTVRNPHSDKCSQLC